VFVLVALDYAVWNMSGGRDVAGMVSGLTLPPLLVVLLWLAALNLLRAIGGATRRPLSRGGANRRLAGRRRSAAGSASPIAADAASRDGAVAGGAQSPSRKIAA
jgi:hypothetical protein